MFDIQLVISYFFLFFACFCPVAVPISLDFFTSPPLGITCFLRFLCRFCPVFFNHFFRFFNIFCKKIIIAKLIKVPSNFFFEKFRSRNFNYFWFANCVITMPAKRIKPMVNTAVISCFSFQFR